MNENLKAALKMIEKHHQNVKQDIQHWVNHEVFSWNWWVLVGFILVPFIIWLILVDRKRMLELLLVWTLVIIPTSYLDAIGIDLKFWVYPVQFLPVTPRAIPFDVFMVGISYMLLYQYFSKWQTYFKALIVLAFVFAFIGEPLSHYLNLVYYVKWKYYYSFIYYILLGVTIKAIISKSKDNYQH
jgi:hypothetical protein